MSNNGFYIFAIVFVLVIGGIFFFNSSLSGKTISSSNVKTEYTNAQVVKLSVVGSNYVLSPSIVKQSVPVRIEADMSTLVGCSKSIVISAFGIQKTLSDSDNIIEFTPDKSGTFNIACSMNMYTGKFTVVDDSGKASYVEPQNAKTGSCSSGSGSSGGCGCGG